MSWEEPTPTRVCPLCSGNWLFDVTRTSFSIEGGQFVFQQWSQCRDCPYSTEPNAL